MKFMNIMVPYDRSEHARNALEVAKGLAEEDEGIKLHVVSVISVTDIPPGMNLSMGTVSEIPATTLDPSVYMELVNEATSHEEKDMWESIGTTLDDMPNEVTVVSINHPSVTEGIIEFAEEHDCDIIIMGSRGLGLFRGMLGSVSRGVLHDAKLPVLIVKGGDEE